MSPEEPKRRKTAISFELDPLFVIVESFPELYCTSGTSARATRDGLGGEAACTVHRPPVGAVVRYCIDARSCTDKRSKWQLSSSVEFCLFAHKYGRGEPRNAKIETNARIACEFDASPGLTFSRPTPHGSARASVRFASKVFVHQGALRGNE